MRGSRFKLSRKKLRWKQKWYLIVSVLNIRRDFLMVVTLWFWSVLKS